MDMTEHIDWIRTMQRKLEITVRDLDDVKSISDALQEIISVEIEFEDSFLAIEQKYRICSEFGHQVAVKEIRSFDTMRVEWEKVTIFPLLTYDQNNRVQALTRKECG